MSNQADSDDDRAISEHNAPIMLPPDAPEAIVLLLVISLGLTFILHKASLTHIVGILILVVISKINTITFNQYGPSLLSKMHCIRDASQNCQNATQAYLSSLGGKALASISGVGSEETVFDTSGALKEEFLNRAGIIGAVASFTLVYNVVRALYSKAYSMAKASAPSTELDVNAGRISVEGTPASTSGRNSNLSNRSNPLMSPEDASKQPTPKPHANPLKVPEETTRCTACEALEAAQADWADAVRDYDEASAIILEENSGLKEQVKMLQQEVAGLGEEGKVLYDRTEYLDVLLEEAGKQLGCEVDV